MEVGDTVQVNAQVSSWHGCQGVLKERYYTLDHEDSVGVIIDRGWYVRFENLHVLSFRESELLTMEQVAASSLAL